MPILRRSGRRVWIRTAASGLGALVLPGCDASDPRAGFLGAMERWNERVQQAMFRPEVLAEELGAEEDTPPGAFPTYFYSDEVPLAPSDWRLQVGGAVARPRTFTLEELQRFPRVDMRVRHHCVEGWSAVASWHGLRVRDLADAVGADRSAPYVTFRSFDSGYHSSWDRPSALHAQSILAYGMNGAPLHPLHGAPLRLYASVKLGYKMVKYLTEVRFLHERTGGTWEDQGYEWFAGV